jgi:ABC-type lipoprotein release transport system permease subunit
MSTSHPLNRGERRLLIGGLSVAGVAGLALVVALGVGIGFGLYPAWHAAGLDPVEALRRE